MVTRANVSGKTQFMELPHKREKRQRKKNLHVHLKVIQPELCTTSVQSTQTTTQSTQSILSTTSEPSSTFVETDDSEYMYESIDSEDSDSDSVSILTTDSFIDSMKNREYEVAIDFDDAHDSWISNKKRTANGTYVYICGYTLSNHKLCKRACCDKIGLYSGCKTHYMWEEKIHKGLEELNI